MRKKNYQFWLKPKEEKMDVSNENLSVIDKEMSNLIKMK